MRYEESLKNIKKMIKNIKSSKIFFKVKVFDNVATDNQYFLNDLNIL